MKLKAIVHEEDGGYWAEVPALPGCASQGDTYEELLANLQEAVEGWVSVEIDAKAMDDKSKVVEIAV